MSEKLTIERIRELRAAITAPWTLSVPTIEISYTNGAILWDGEGCNFGEVAPTEEDYGQCAFDGKSYQNSNANFAIAAPEAIDLLLAKLDEERERCALIALQFRDSSGYKIPQRIAEAIRAGRVD